VYSGQWLTGGWRRRQRQALTSPFDEQGGSRGLNETAWMFSSEAALHCMLPLPSFAK
jgi:hypothetical protein